MKLKAKKILSIFFFTIFSATPAMANCNLNSKGVEVYRQRKIELKWVGEPDEYFGKCILFNNLEHDDSPTVVKPNWNEANRRNDFGIGKVGEFNCGNIQMRQRKHKPLAYNYMGIMPNNSESYVWFTRLEKEDEFKYLEGIIQEKAQRYGGRQIVNYPTRNIYGYSAIGNPEYEEFSCKSSEKNIICRQDYARYLIYGSERTSKKLFRRDTESEIRVCKKLVEAEF